jgi:hypothetical protein
MSEGYYDNELLSDGNAVKDGNVVPPDSFEFSVTTKPEREYPEADGEVFQIDQHTGYTPAPIETTVDSYKDKIDSHRRVSDQETTRTDHHLAYIPGPLETIIDIYKDRVSPYRQESDEDACIANNIEYEDLLAEIAASIEAMRQLDNFVTVSIVKTSKTK